MQNCNSIVENHNMQKAKQDEKPKHFFTTALATSHRHAKPIITKDANDSGAREHLATRCDESVANDPLHSKKLIGSTKRNKELCSEKQHCTYKHSRMQPSSSKTKKMSSLFTTQKAVLAFFERNAATCRKSSGKNSHNSWL